MAFATLFIVCVTVAANLASTGMACDTAAIPKCGTDYAAAVGNVGADYASITEENFNKLCSAGRAFFSCLQTAFESCDTSTQNTYKDAFKEPMKMLYEFCTLGYGCAKDFYACLQSKTNMDLNNLPNFSEINATFCGYLDEYSDCYFDKSVLPQSCTALSFFNTARKGIESVLQYCSYSYCDGYKTCVKTYNDVAVNGFSEATCTAFSVFAGCVNDVSCYDERQYVTSAGEKLEGSVITALMNDGCTLLNSKSGFMTCGAFVSCVNTLAQQTTFARDNLCAFAQKVVRCATDSVDACSVVDGEVFAQELSQFNIRLGSYGCGRPDIDVSSCPAYVLVCKSPLSASDTTFQQDCTAVATFLTCADRAGTSCKFLPAVSNGQKPTLKGISGIATEMCDELGAVTCNDFLTCLGSRSSIIPTSDGLLLSAANWCQVGTRVIQCAEITKTPCQFSDSLMGKLKDIRSKFITQGKCSDPFTSTQEGGAERLGPLSLVSTVGLLLMGILATWL